MDENLVERVRRFVAKETSYSLQKITPETTLFGDIGIDGDDGDDFFIAFAKEFQVNLQNLDLSKHFGDESGVSPLGCLLLLFFWIRSDWPEPHKWAGKIPIRVQDLIEAAAEKRWKNPTKPGDSF